MFFMNQKCPWKSPIFVHILEEMKTQIMIIKRKTMSELIIVLLWEERRKPRRTPLGRETAIQSACPLWPGHELEIAGQLTFLPTCLGFSLSNEEVGRTTEMQWKRHVLLSSSPVPGSVPGPGHRADGTCCHTLQAAGRQLVRRRDNGTPAQRGQCRLLWEQAT